MESIPLESWLPSYSIVIPTKWMVLNQLDYDDYLDMTLGEKYIYRLEQSQIKVALLNCWWRFCVI